MKVLTQNIFTQWMVRWLRAALMVAGTGLLAACEPGTNFPMPPEETNQVQDIQSFLVSFAREALAAFLF